jgi:hypothetical protein
VGEIVPEEGYDLILKLLPDYRARRIAGQKY